MSSRRQIFRVIVVASLILGLTPHRIPARTIQNAGDTVCTPVLPRPNPASETPYTSLRVHDAGNLRLSVNNWGVFGNPGYLNDPKTGLPAPGATFPAGYSFEYLSSGALWVGAIVKTWRGEDTLVSTAFDLTEFYPDTYDNGGDFIERSTDKNSPYYSPDAVSIQDLICTYSDTLTNPTYVPFDPVTSITHQPLYIRVRQNSYVWPYKYAEDFVVIQYWITNMRPETLHELYVGILVNPKVWHPYNTKQSAGRDNVVGFLHTAPTITGYGFNVPVNTAWWADNDGDPVHKAFNELSVRSVMGLRFVGINRPPCYDFLDSVEYSFNWWVGQRWGPQHQPGDLSVYGTYGAPLGDAQKYRYMANGEIDYDQHLTGEYKTSEGWMPNTASQGDTRKVSDGTMSTFLLSAGPFELEAGDSIPIGIAVVAGDLFHRLERNRLNPGKQPHEWYDNLDFTDLKRNIQWAAWLYDNPGVNTNGDSCAGLASVSNCRNELVHYDEFCWRCHDTICCIYDGWWMDEVCDSVYYTGDGIPDLKGPPPPPAPQISVYTEPNKIHIEWDGRETETYFDNFSQRRDFEGYNVYGGIGHNPNALTLMYSWDLINYDRYRHAPEIRSSEWVLSGPPFNIEKLYQMYGDEFDPTQHTDQSSYFEDQNGERFYFKSHGGNRGNEYIYHSALTSNPIQYVRTDSLWDETKQTWVFFGHYECTLDNLLPSQPYYVAVTAFDGGVPGGEFEPLESSTLANLQMAYPSYSPDYVAAKQMEVSVYPNPYKIDARYRERRFEDPNREGFKERTRRIHFVNLPPKATIKIFSLDGDLIREIHHPESRFSDTPSHTAWDLITRNTQAVTSGIYLYSVESDWGTQIGKIVIIK